MAVTSPLALTVATLFSEDVQVTACSASSGSMVAVNWRVCPTSIVASVLSNVTEVTDGTGGTGVPPIGRIVPKSRHCSAAL